MEGFPDECPRCDSEVEDKVFGVSCSNFNCLWKRWTDDKLDNFSAETHEDRHRRGAKDRREAI